MAKEEKINYKQVFVKAAISALATVATIGVVKFFDNKNTMGLNGALHLFANLPTKEQARFADAETMKNAGNPKWLVEQFANIDITDERLARNANHKTIANLAFIALYGNHTDSRLKAIALLDKLKNIA